MQRRRFLFWMTAGLFGLGETLGIDLFDRIAAAAVRRSSGSSGSSGGSSSGSRNGLSTGKAIDFNARPTYANNQGNFINVPSGPIVDDDVDDPTNHGKTEPKRIARQGRPPSRWLRSLNAEELRLWLRSVNPVATGVSGMTYEMHLTRDHLFMPEKIAGLTIDEQAKLHAAAHAGY